MNHDVDDIKIFELKMEQKYHNIYASLDVTNNTILLLKI